MQPTITTEQEKGYPRRRGLLSIDKKQIANPL
jgi:hypothetical protein